MSGNTPAVKLIQAIKQRNYAEILEALSPESDNPAHPLLSNADNDGKTPLMIAADLIDAKAVSIIINNSKILDDERGVAAVRDACKKILKSISEWGMIPDSMRELFTSIIAKNQNQLILSLLDTVPDQTKHNLLLTFKGLTLPEQIWQNLFSEYNENKIYTMLSHDAKNPSIVSAAMNLISSDITILDSFLQSRHTYKLQLNQELWAHIFNTKYKGHYSIDDISRILIQATTNRNITLLSFIVPIIIATRDLQLNHKAIESAVALLDSDSLILLINANHNQPELLPLMREVLSSNEFVAATVSKEAIRSIFRAELIDGFSRETFLNLLQNLDQKHKYILMSSLIGQLVPLQIKTILSDDRIYNYELTWEIWKKFISIADISGSSVRFLLQKSMSNKNDFFYREALRLLEKDSKQRELFFTSDNVFSEPFPASTWFAIYKATNRTSKDMADNAIQYNNIKLFIAALKIFNETPNAMDTPNLLQGLDFFTSQTSEISEGFYSEAIKFLTSNSSGDIEISQHAFLNIFQELGDNPDIKEIISLLKKLSTNSKSKLLDLFILNLSEEKIPELLTKDGLFSISFSLDTWQVILPHASLIGLSYTDLISKAIKYNNNNLFIALIDNIQNDAPAATVTILTENNFRALRWMLARISKSLPNYQEDTLWQIITKIMETKIGEELKTKLTALALVSVSNTDAIDVDVMLAASQLFELSTKIQNYDPSNNDYNPILFEIKPHSKAPSNLFKYYLQNYHNYKNLFDLPKDAKLTNRVNLLKYLLRHYETLHNFDAYKSIVENLIDEDMFAKINLDFAKDLIGYSQDDDSAYCDVTVLSEYILEKIFIPMGFKLHEMSKNESYTNKSSLEVLKNSPIGLLDELYSCAKDTENPLQSMLAQEICVEIFMPPEVKLQGSQSAHDEAAAANFDNFTDIYQEDNPEAIPEKEQLTYIRLFMLYNIHNNSPRHPLLLHILGSKVVQELFADLEKINNNFPLFYLKYKNLPELDPVLEFLINTESNNELSEAAKFSLETALKQSDDNYYANQALVSLRAVRNTANTEAPDEENTNQFLLDATLRAGTAHLIQYMYIYKNYLQRKITSHDDILRVLLKLIIDDKEHSQSSDRQRLLTLYAQNRDTEFVYTTYEAILEDIFIKHQSNSRDAFCVQVADAVTAYLEEGQSPSASVQSCLTGYKSRMNQLLDSDILYGRLPSDLQILQMFLTELLKERLQDLLNKTTDINEQREILGSYLSNRVANAALLAAGKSDEILNYFGNNAFESKHLFNLIDISDQLENSHGDKLTALYCTVSDLFENNAVFNPDKITLKDITNGVLTLKALLSMGGGELVISKLDKFFRERYGIKEQNIHVAKPTLIESITLQAIALDNAIMYNQANTNAMLPAKAMTIIKSKISHMVPLLIELQNGTYTEGNIEDETRFNSLKAELINYIYSRSSNQALQAGDFQRKIENMFPVLKNRVTPLTSDRLKRKI